MGCGSAVQAAQVADAQVKSTGTLLEPSHQKPWVASETESFPIFMDSLSGCLEVNGERLQITSVNGGPIGLWNNRPRTDKVRKGDFVVKVRKAGATQWISSDTKQMLAAFDAAGPFEVEIKHAEPRTTADEPKVQGPAPAPAAAAPAAAPLAAPAAAPEAASEPALTPAAAPVVAPEAAPVAAPAAAPEAAPEAVPEPAPAAAPTETLVEQPLAAEKEEVGK